MFKEKSYINHTFLASTQIVDLYYTRTEANELLANKVSTSGSSNIPDVLKTWILRCSEIRILSYDDGSCLRILQLEPGMSIFNNTTTEQQHICSFNLKARHT